MEVEGGGGFQLSICFLGQGGNVDSKRQVLGGGHASKFSKFFVGVCSPIIKTLTHFRLVLKKISHTAYT